MKGEFRMSKWRKPTIAAVGLVLAAGVSAPAVSTAAGAPRPKVASATTTPIQHLVVIFQENVSFDHYFGTYPNATNTSGQPLTVGVLGLAVNG